MKKQLLILCGIFFLSNVQASDSDNQGVCYRLQPLEQQPKMQNPWGYTTRVCDVIINGASSKNFGIVLFIFTPKHHDFGQEIVYQIASYDKNTQALSPWRTKDEHDKDKVVANIWSHVSSGCRK